VIEQPREDWQVLIQDAHPGYIAWEEFERNQVTLMHNRTAWTSSGPNPLPRESPSWEEFERNQVTLKQNLAALSTEGRGTLPREGIALLQGRVLCGRCGARMRTRYEQFRDHLIPYHVCTDAVVRRAGKFCQSIRGSDIDEAVGELLLKTLAPAALDVALAVQAEIAGRIEQADTLRQQQLEWARYEAELKRRRFLKCDPDHRLVADALEADWNDQLRRLETLQQEHERQRQADQSLLDEAARARILSLARNFPRMWNDPRTESRDRKRMLALLIEDVTLTKTDPIAVHVRFRGGQTTSLTVQGPKSIALIRKFSPEFIAELDQLLETYPEKEAAEQLNARGRRNWKQRPLTRSAVFNLRFIYKLKSHYQRLRERGMLSSEELGQRLGVSATMINKMGRAGLLVRHFYGNRDCLYDPVQAGTIRKGKAGRPSITLDDPSQVRFRRDRPRWNPDERHSGRFDRLRLMRIGILAVRLCMRRIVKFDDSDDAKITPAQHEVGDELLKFTSNCLPIRGAGTNIDDLRQGHLGQDDAFRIHDT